MPGQAGLDWASSIRVSTLNIIEMDIACRCSLWCQGSYPHHTPMPTPNLSGCPQSLSYSRRTIILEYGYVKELSRRGSNGAQISDSQAQTSSSDERGRSRPRSFD